MIQRHGSVPEINALEKFNDSFQGKVVVVCANMVIFKQKSIYSPYIRRKLTPKPMTGPIINTQKTNKFEEN